MHSDLSHRLLDTLLSGMNVILDEIADMEPTTVATYTEPLERYAFLVKWMTEMMEKHRDQHGFPSVLTLMSKTVRIVSDRMWSSKAMRDTFVSRCILQPVMLCQENEAYLKVQVIKQGMFKVLCLAVKLHGQAFHVQTSILQALQ